MIRCRCARPLGFVFLAFLFLEPWAAGQSTGCEAPGPSERRESTKINVVSVEFSGDSPLSDEDRAQFTKAIQNRPLLVEGSQPDANSFDPDTELIRNSLQNRGYFEAAVTGNPFLVRANQNDLEYALRIGIESGHLYHVGEISLTSSSEKRPLVFDASTLRQKIPLEVGDVFDVSKLRDGLRGITHLYGTKGYLDATIEPEFDIRDAQPDHPAIDIVLRIDEHIPYRLRSTAFLGLDTRKVERLQSQLPQQTGELFNSALWQNFFKQNESSLPPGASLEKNFYLKKDPTEGFVDIAFDLRRCPASL